MKKKLLLVVTAVTIFLSPNLIFSQAPTLGTAAGFVLYSSTGAVTNSGISQVTGNVGTNSGSSTGFGNVNGVMHDNDAASATCANDLLIAYNQLNSAIATAHPAALLGNGDTLTAGVYKIDTITTLSGNLILDAKGNAGAVFIFQIGSTFSITASSKIILANKALACNIFWKVEGAVTIATAAFMRGTIIARNAPISISSKDTLEGRALCLTGAVAVTGVLAYTPIGCGSPVLKGPAAPHFGISGCFAIFSGSGTVSNAGISHITGDVGTNVGLTSGYDEVYVTGYIHPIPDQYTASCAADLINVYNYLNTLPDDIELLYPPQFGRNLVLTPHTYIMNGATALTDSLYLNGQGNYNAVFVIKVKGALSTSTFSKVLLMNGTQAKNVYWVVDGAVSISDSSIFNGTIICNMGAISLASGVTLNGRALTTGGALSTAAVIVTSPSGNCNLLPVSWLYFRGKPGQKNVLLEWGTTNEINNGFFTIEKSRDGISFETLTTTTARREIVTRESNYSFTDNQPFSINYYRISQTDKDGHKTYFRTIMVKMNMNLGLNVVHYVKDNYIYVQASNAAPGNGSIQLYDINGKKISSQKIALTKEVSTYKIEKQLNKGMYLLYIESQGEKLYHGKVMVL